MSLKKKTSAAARRCLKSKCAGMTHVCTQKICKVRAVWYEWVRYATCTRLIFNRETGRDRWTGYSLVIWKDANHFLLPVISYRYACCCCYRQCLNLPKSKEKKVCFPSLYPPGFFQDITIFFLTITIKFFNMGYVVTTTCKFLHKGFKTVISDCPCYFITHSVRAIR
jgi:hypothetical protein